MFTAPGCVLYVTGLHASELFVCVCKRVRTEAADWWVHSGRAWRAQWTWRGTTWRSWMSCPTTWSSTCCRPPTAPAAWCPRRTRSSSSLPKTRGWAGVGGGMWCSAVTEIRSVADLMVWASHRHSLTRLLLRGDQCYWWYLLLYLVSTGCRQSSASPAPDRLHKENPQ